MAGERNNEGGVRAFRVKLLEPFPLSHWGMVAMKPRLVEMTLDDQGLVEGRYVSKIKILNTEIETSLAWRPEDGTKDMLHARATNDVKAIEAAGFIVDWDSLELIRQRNTS